eukprot:CAMPEP_0197691204 /NCGR_PEP_ID=MMETSP1338-20131121/109394_1 /TAXON_ID=43686 ORGANISM="Pelagodinium beii, Strain RCC1491" /NCGR_SAMPLE_ID=MMETSP1338 /ASSEMBLY_ACC=CAM_ASM_000754 /LENGTH=37 /DNA_ID= /DNA_START= /DNA_END= /DNA_ORIENTATION=
MSHLSSGYSELAGADALEGSNCGSFICASFASDLKQR